MDEILTAMEQIDSLYSSPDLEEIYLKISTQKCETGNVYEKDENNEWDFGAFIPPANKEIPESDLVDDKINPTNNAGDEDEEEEAEEVQIFETWKLLYQHQWNVTIKSRFHNFRH